MAFCSTQKNAANGNNSMEEKYPVRINKYLALQNICSRHEADNLIAEGRVKINGRVAVLGDKVNEGDRVEVSGVSKKLAYFVFNKPKGIITHSPQKGEKEIKDIVDLPEGIFPLGRLDKDSTGLIILTNDGRLTGKLLSPEQKNEKEYFVKVTNPIDQAFIEKLSQGVRLDDGYVTQPCRATKINKKKFSIVLTEGKKRQIRRMCEALGNQVEELERVRIMDLKLASLAPGDFREIKGKELADFLKKVGL